MHTGSTVKNLGLHEDDGVTVTDRSQKKTLGLNRGTGDNNLQTGSVGKVGLGMLGMVMSTMSDSAARGTYTQSSDVELSSGTVAVLGSFVDELICR